MGMVTTGAPPAPGAPMGYGTVATSSQYTLEVVDIIRAKNALKEWKRVQREKAERRALAAAGAGADNMPQKKKRLPAVRWSEAEETALREGMVK